MKRLLTILISAVLYGGYAMAYDFSAVCESGQTLYYNITSDVEPYTVAVTSCGTIGNGDLRIPFSVAYNGRTYLVASIGEAAFYDCRLTEVTIPESVTSIGDMAFYACCITRIVIPNSVTSIGYGAFMPYFANSTESIVVDSENPIYDSRDNCNALIETATNTLVVGCRNTVIPNSVTSIGVYAFNNCSGLTSINIPNSVTSIGDYAFNKVKNIVYSGTATGSPWGALTVNGLVDGYLVYSDNTKTNLTGCSTLATSVTIPSSVISIGEHAFSDCSGLTSVTIPNSVTSIGDYAFSCCSGLTSVYYTGDIEQWCVITFGYGANPLSDAHNLYIDNELVTNLEIPNTITQINDYAFEGATCFTSVTIPNSVTSIGSSAFYGCSGLTGTLTIPNSVTSIGSEAFYLCSRLTEVTIGNSVTSVGHYAFFHCGLTTVNFNATNCTAMGNSSYPVFSHCTSLATVNIGDNVTNIPDYAFSGCSEFESVYSRAVNPPAIQSNTFNSSISSIPVFVPCGCVSVYNDTENWNVFTNIQENPDCAGVEENESANIEMYPNPVGNTLYISAEETISEIEIVNIMGQVVRRIEINADNAVCNVEDLKAGVYIVRLRTLRQAQGAVIVQKFIKE